MPGSIPSLLVVVPAFNEEASVGDVVREVHAAMPDALCLVVDDGSVDATARIARDAGATVLELPFNLGVGGAMRAGFRFARDNGYTVVVQVDADGQHDPHDIPTLLARLDDADIVVGSRFAGAGEYDARGPRRWAMRFLARAVSLVAHRSLPDVTSGFKATGARGVALFAHTYPAEYLGDTVEALVIAARAGLRIEPVAIAMRERQAGLPSHHPVRASVYLLRAGIAFLLALMRPRVRIEEGTVS
ncbi:glycosyltransferase [Microbacterium invictum]|uniref:Glycosyltransferase involved in cell wall biosynthesis n=1 Tax=Microbacterium invictum TaxID=515415 RepID=A0AA40SP43_9MICO|nr:glycosyltransferase family 2 protein [Microbacterium invictum]MBB4139778.1 glycosyltransferase involved in cell wall biosynthesis [Microbacterium invictum]